MDGQHLYILYKDNLVENLHNVFRVVGNIDFIEGKAFFKIENGNTVRVNVDLIEHIGISGNMEYPNNQVQVEAD